MAARFPSGLTVDDVRSPATRTRTIAVLVETRYLAQRQPAGLVAALRSHGLDPLVLDPAGHDPASLDHVRLAVARGRSAAVLGALEAMERRGAATLNRSAAIRGVLDKANMASVLARAGVPVPPTRVVPARDLARAVAPEAFPMVVKPIAGDNARGVTLVADEAGLRALRWSEPVALAQPFVRGDGRDLKLYVAGDTVWAVRKASPLLDASWRSAPAEVVPLQPAWRELALACGRAFGLELYGVDCVLDPSGPVVIEVNDFPNYSAIPAVDACLAHRVVAALRRVGTAS